MTNRDLIVLQGVVRNILADYLAVYPRDACEVERDLLRLSLISQTRGLATFLLDLPAMGKHFDACLSGSVFSPPRLPLGSLRWKGSPIPKLFSGLLIRVFDIKSGRLLDDVDPFIVQTLRQLYFFAKGFVYECSPQRADKAIREFYTVDLEVQSPSLNWFSDVIELDQLRSLLFDESVDDSVPLEGSNSLQESRSIHSFTETLHKTCDIVATGFGEFSSEEWVTRHGPGAVADLKGSSSKYDFPNWSAKLDRVFPYDYHAFMHYDHWVETIDQPCSVSEPSSKLLTVPKTAKSPRIIASEPVAHQWCQQGILRYLMHGIQETALKNCLSLNDQEPSRALVLEASHSRSHATIDLSAASDRVSCWLVERVFRANPSLVEALHSVRSRWIDNGTRTKVDQPRRFPLRKFTTMGSACTFPIQSIVFALISIATVLYEEGQDPTPSNIRRVSKRVRVFGDDMIIPNEHFASVTSNLEVFGLRINHAKSFSEGSFRESCGMDAWDGHDVTPAHLNRVADESQPASVVATLDASNNFYLKGFWRTASYIESTLPHWVRKNLAVVAADSGAIGVKSFCGPFVDFLPSRWNVDLQKTEIRTIKPRGSVERSSYTGRHSLFQRFVERPLPESIWESGRVMRSKAYLALGWEDKALLL